MMWQARLREQLSGASATVLPSWMCSVQASWMRSVQASWMRSVQASPNHPAIAYGG